LTPSLLLSWREGISTAADAAGALRVQGPCGVVVLRRLAPFLAAALDRLAPPGCAEDRLTEAILETGGTDALARWYYLLQGLARRGFLCRALHADGRRLATLVPISTAFVLAAPAPRSDAPRLLSRFAYLRRDGEAMVLESPMAHARIILDDERALSIVGALAKPALTRELVEHGKGLSAEAGTAVLSLLADAGMLEEESSAQHSWEFHDLLFHARSRKGREVDLPTPSGPVRMEFLSRPYPSGGALYELEFYVAVQSCDGLAAGLYYHDGQQHRLARLRERTAEVDQLLADAAASAGIAAERVQVLLILAARFPRLTWKYASIAYALILKHGGVVYQTMYLTATAMNLAPCALGGGDADLFARAAGTNYYEETSVGEFLLGSLKRPLGEAMGP
jgi:SagB-type dehydrogenase family enzyme